jgi:hypothetical protein
MEPEFEFPSQSFSHLIHLDIECHNADYQEDPTEWSLPFLQSLRLIHTNCSKMIRDKEEDDIDDEEEMKKKWKWCSKHLNRLDIDLPMTLSEWRHLLTISSSIQSLSFDMKSDVTPFSLISHHFSSSLQSLSLGSDDIEIVQPIVFTVLQSMASLKHLTIKPKFVLRSLDESQFDRFPPSARLISLNSISDQRNMIGN